MGLQVWALNSTDRIFFGGWGTKLNFVYRYMIRDILVDHSRWTIHIGTYSYAVRNQLESHSPLMFFLSKKGLAYQGADIIVDLQVSHRTPPVSSSLQVGGQPTGELS